MDFYFGSLYRGIRCGVGGKFTAAGPVSSKSIALWQQGVVVNPQSSSFSGGLTDDGVSNLPKVYGIQATTVVDLDGRSAVCPRAGSKRNRRVCLRKFVARGVACQVRRW